MPIKPASKKTEAELLGFVVRFALERDRELCTEAVEAVTAPIERLLAHALQILVFGRGSVAPQLQRLPWVRDLLDRAPAQLTFYVEGGSATIEEILLTAHTEAVWRFIEALDTARQDPRAVVQAREEIARFREPHEAHLVAAMQALLALQVQKARY